MLVQRKQPAQRASRGLRIHPQGTRPITLVHPVRTQPVDVRGVGAGLAHVRLDLFPRMAEGESLGLREAVLQRQVLTLGASPRPL